MKVKFLVVATAMLLAIGLSVTASAGTVADADGDLVPDATDNCLEDPNGEDQASNQVDTDSDGFGNACDCDFDQNNETNGLDIVQLFGVFLTGSELEDIDGNGEVNGLDVVNCFGRFLEAPGPSALAP